MNELKMLVPTYYGNAHGKSVPHDCLPEFGEPNVPVLVRDADGIRVVLGSHDFDDMSAPDVSIERRPCGWAIFLHPLGASDPSGYVFFHDDGRSFMVKESGLGPTKPIVEKEYERCTCEIDSCDGWKLVNSDKFLKASPQGIVVRVEHTFQLKTASN